MSDICKTIERKLDDDEKENFELTGGWENFENIIEVNKCVDPVIPFEYKHKIYDIYDYFKISTIVMKEGYKVVSSPFEYCNEKLILRLKCPRDHIFDLQSIKFLIDKKIGWCDKCDSIYGKNMTKYMIEYLTKRKFVDIPQFLKSSSEEFEFRTNINNEIEYNGEYSDDLKISYEYMHCYYCEDTYCKCNTGECEHIQRLYYDDFVESICEKNNIKLIRVSPYSKGDKILDQLTKQLCGIVPDLDKLKQDFDYEKMNEDTIERVYKAFYGKK